MKTNNKTYSAILIFIFALLYIGCNGKSPVIDNSLSPPIIGKPLYNCSEIISFSGADRDAKIRVYVNGTIVKEINTWMGWGSIIIPSPLHKGDVVAADQITDNHISYQTREPVTVIEIPPDLIPGRKLNTPEIIPPLYECQKVIRVKNILEGATVSLRNIDADTYRDMTPYNIVRIVLPPLKLNDEWYNANQYICIDPPFSSDWSVKERIQPKPIELPGATIHEPIIVGNDACRVDTLIPGTDVDVYATDGTGTIRIGGGVALDSSTIFRINPSFKDNVGYNTFQTLCDVKSPAIEKIKPITEIPQPEIQAPICEGDIYVTICNTVPMSTVKVYLDGTQVAQAARNGNCITIALGNNTTFSTNQKVTAIQFVAGKPSTKSKVQTVFCGDTYLWENGTSATD